MGTNSQNKGNHGDFKNVANGLAHNTGHIAGGGGPHTNSCLDVVKYFGCLQCSWAGTDQCEHGIHIGGHHANWICKTRMKFLTEQYKICGSVPKIIQQEELFKLKQISDRLVFKYVQEGELPDEFKHISKLLISLTDKMRRQDEGIKMFGDITLSHDTFKEMIEVEAKKIEEKDNRTRPAEFTEEVPTGG